MRQAGRSLPEYRKLRERADFVTMCRTPELAVEATLQPIDRLGVDAAILFSDILIPADCLGVRVAFEPGPVIDEPIRTTDDIARLAAMEPEQTVPFVYETLRILRRELDGRVPVIGFAGAPLTLAAYLVEGRGSKSFSAFKGLLFGNPSAAHELLDKVSRVTEDYLDAQVRAGAQAIQLFDTWAGLLDRAAFREFGLRYARRVLEHLSSAGVPRIYFALDSAHLFEEIRECAADVVGVDWRVDLLDANQRLGGRFALQGNLDPCVLFGSPAEIDRRAGQILERGRELAGHVFNLGHGVLPDTPVEHVQALVDAVKRHGAR
jgi:uroporphyrinogen decarboxylase